MSLSSDTLSLEPEPVIFRVGQIVKLRLTRAERDTYTYNRNHIVCQIKEFNVAQTHVKLLSEWGMITKSFALNRLLPGNRKTFFNPAPGTRMTQLDFNKAMQDDAKYGFRYGTRSCDCHNKCRTKYCPCHRARRECNVHCHIYGGESKDDNCANK